MRSQRRFVPRISGTLTFIWMARLHGSGKELSSPPRTLMKKSSAKGRPLIFRLIKYSIGKMARLVVRATIQGIRIFLLIEDGG